MTITPGQWIHMVGIAGAGMSGIAKVLVERGFTVSGSDLQCNDTTKKLEQLGVIFYHQHSSANLKEGVDKLVISSAVSLENEEVKEAISRGIPVIKRGQMLAELIDDDQVIAVAGAHGKTTTTAMIFTVLESCRIDPTFVVGGEIRDSGLNAKNGSGPCAVIEADESDASFLALKPYMAVVTNIEDDHLDYYKTRQNIERAFAEYLAGVRPDGVAILFGDDPAVANVRSHCPAKVLLYGEDPQCDYVLKNWQPKKLGSQFDVYHQNQRLGRAEISIPGKHNAFNALAAIISGIEAGLAFEDVIKAIKGYTGAKRRFQIIGERAGIMVVDDYAHHPTEINATLQAARDFHSGRLVVVFQPHRYTRTRDLGPELGKALTNADLAIVTEIYAAGEAIIPGVTGKTVVQAAQGRKNTCQFVQNSHEALDYLLAHTQPNDLIITMGAGDIWKLGEAFLEKMNCQE